MLKETSETVKVFVVYILMMLMLKVEALLHP
jgi:hypothetical protein